MDYYGEKRGLGSSTHGARPAKARKPLVAAKVGAAELTDVMNQLFVAAESAAAHAARANELAADAARIAAEVHPILAAARAVPEASPGSEAGLDNMATPCRTRENGAPEGSPELRPAPAPGLAQASSPALNGNGMHADARKELANRALGATQKSDAGKAEAARLWQESIKRAKDELGVQDKQAVIARARSIYARMVQDAPKRPPARPPDRPPDDAHQGLAERPQEASPAAPTTNGSASSSAVASDRAQGTVGAAVSVKTEVPASEAAQDTPTRSSSDAPRLPNGRLGIRLRVPDSIRSPRTSPMEATTTDEPPLKVKRELASSPASDLATTSVASASLSRTGVACSPDAARAAAAEQATASASIPTAPAAAETATSDVGAALVPSALAAIASTAPRRLLVIASNDSSAAPCTLEAHASARASRDSAQLPLEGVSRSSGYSDAGVLGSEVHVDFQECQAFEDQDADTEPPTDDETRGQDSDLEVQEVPALRRPAKARRRQSRPPAAPESGLPEPQEVAADTALADGGSPASQSLLRACPSLMFAQRAL